MATSSAQASTSSSTKVCPKQECRGKECTHEKKELVKEMKEEPVQAMPASETDMKFRPKFEAEWYKGSGKLRGKVALITGGDSGIGRSVAVLFAREGALVAINYLHAESKDAEETKRWIESKEHGRCLLLPGDLKDPAVCESIVRDTMSNFRRLDILVNNHATQCVKECVSELTPEQLMETFQTNIISLMLVTREAMKYLPEGEGSIINTSSVVAYKGKADLLDYSATKGAVTAFTHALALQQAKRGIRVNSVAPGPVWTPLIASYTAEQRKEISSCTVLGRMAHPEEVSPSYVFLASHDSCFFTGQTLHPNGGSMVC